ncbi:MAG: hypothetical protein JKX75_01785 [Gammaproteobacteria bacterium]|nr:hypothetical protein [Gammaproteobacteria bacterium]
MNLQNNLSWFFSIAVFVSLFVAGSYLYGYGSEADLEMIQFSELSNTDMDLIISVKEEMRAATNLTD